MLQASSERPAAPAGVAAAGLWLPGMSGPRPQAVGVGSARAQEIARKREEMFAMLHDVPESEYELSLTDIVEKVAGAGGGSGMPPSERKEAGPEPEPARSASGRLQGEPPAAAAAAARTERKGSARRPGDGGSSLRSSSDGVLLNFYMPRALTRSFTAPRPGRTLSVSGGRAASVPDDCNKRDRDGDTVKCWSLPWDRRRRKSSRRDPNELASESTVRTASAAILAAARHTAPPAKT